MPLLAVSRALAALTVVVTVVSFVTAGAYLQSDDGAIVEIHGTAAIVLHVVTGLLAISLALLARDAGRGWWAPVLAALLFGYTFVQAAISGSLAYHVTGAFFVAVVPVVLLTWLVVGRATSHRSDAVSRT